MALRRPVSVVLMALALVVAAPGKVWAQGAPPRTPDEPRFALGLGVISSPRPYVDADNELQAIPILEAYWKRFYFQGIRAGYRLVEGDRLNLDLTARWSFTRLDPDDSDFLAGMEERDATAMAGLGLDWNLSREWQLSLRADADVLGRHDGLEAETQLTWRRRIGQKLVLAPSLGAAWQSADLVDHYVGVRPEEARPDRPAYEGPAAWSFTANLTGLWFINPR
jgi:outer membrane protein